jgi:hypothetical protein
LSYWIKSSGAYSGTVTLELQLGTTANTLLGGTWSASAVTSTVTPTGTWTRYQATGTITAGTVGLRVRQVLSTAQASGIGLFITGVQIELGSVATTFTRSGGTIQGELAACQRYYWRSTTSTTGSHGIGATQSAASAIVGINLPVTMRVVPTSIDFANLRLVNYGVAAYSISTITLSAGESTQNFINIDCAGASGMTANRPVFLYGTGSAGYIGANAEL